MNGLTRCEILIIVSYLMKFWTDFAVVTYLLRQKILFHRFKMLLWFKNFCPITGTFNEYLPTYVFRWVAWVASLFPFQALFKERYETMSVENQQACRLRFQKLRERLLVSIDRWNSLAIFQMRWIVCRLMWGPVVGEG